MGQKLIPESLYNPIGGMNPDANGLMAKPIEANDIVNCIVSLENTIPRKGTKALVRIENIVVSGAGYPGSPTMNGTYEPSYYDTQIDPPYDYKFENLPKVYHVYQVESTPLKWRIRDTTAGSDIYTIDSDSIYPPKTGWTAINPANNPAPTISYDLSIMDETILEFHEYIHPTDGVKVFAFCANTIYRFDDGTGWVECLDGAVSFSNLEQWSITNVVDKTLGATIIAAGSEYTRPNEAYADGATRELLYYDITTDTFKDFQPKKNLYGEELVVSGLTAPGVVTGSLSSPKELLSGATYFVVDTIGVVATASQNESELLLGVPTTETRVNRLIPVDDAEVGFSDSSYINLETGDFSIDFKQATYNGLNLRIFYQYKDDADFRPLYVTNFRGALIFGNTSELLKDNNPGYNWYYFPWRVRWSLQNDINIFRERDYQELTLGRISPILGIKPLETEASSTIFGPLYIYRHNSVIRASYNQNYNLNPAVPTPMLNFEIALSEGIEATRTLVNIDMKHFYLGRNDIYVFDGVRRRSLTLDENTGGTRIRKYIFDRMNLNNLNSCFGVYDEIDKKYLLFIATQEDSFPTECFVYDLILGTWTRRIYPEISAAINIDLVPGGTIEELQGNIEDLEGTIENLTGLRTKLILFAHENHAYYESPTSGYDLVNINSQVYESYFITKDFLGRTLEEQDRVSRVVVEGFGDDIELSWNAQYSLNKDLFFDAEDLNYTSLYEAKMYDPDVVGSHIRFKVLLSYGAIFRWMQVFSVQQELTNE